MAGRARVAGLGLVGLAVLLSVAATSGEKPAGSEAAEAYPEAAAILELRGDPAYGAYLAGECVTCHRPSGSPGIPPIAGLDPTLFVTALVEFRRGDRHNEVMRTTASRLGDAEIAALAAHFGSLEPH